MLSSASLASKAAYQLKWYHENRDEVLAKRRATYAADTDWQAKRAARRQSVKLANAKKKAAYRAMVDELKKAPCLDCAECFPPECMDFDHVRGAKLFQIGQMGQRQLPLVLAEIAKCDLVCANCHRVRTMARLRQAKPV
jgi:hypothetical protein